MMKTTQLAKLRRKPYRDAYVKAHLQQGLAFQIKEMRLDRKLTQSQLAKALKLGGQSAVARLEDPSYGRMSLNTLLKVAAFFDVALITKMVPYSRFLAETRDVSPKALVAESFESEDAAGAIENAPEFQLIRSAASSGHGITQRIRAWPARQSAIEAPTKVISLPFRSTSGAVFISRFSQIEQVPYHAPQD